MPQFLQKLHNFDYDAFFFNYRYYICLFLLGVILVGLGVLASKKGLTNASKVEVIGSVPSASTTQEIVAEISGQVVKPGVYKLVSGARIEDLLVLGDGLAADADRDWVDKNLNRAAKVSDGQKIFIPTSPAGGPQQSEVLSAKNTGGVQTVSPVLGAEKGTLININSASLMELDTLPGIGPVYAQKIIDHRPYSTGEEMVSKKVISQSIYDKIKNRISVY